MQVKWHVKDKPLNDGFYMITTAFGLVRCARYHAKEDAWDTSCTIIAWAELPEGFKNESR